VMIRRVRVIRVPLTLNIFLRRGALIFFAEGGTMACPKCGAHLSTDARFCSVCGSELSAQAGSPTANVGPTPPSGHAGASGIHIDSDGRGSGRGYSYEVLYQGAFALATVKLQAEQSINAEAGAMVAMSGNVELYSQMK